MARRSVREAALGIPRGLLLFIYLIVILDFFILLLFFSLGHLPSLCSGLPRLLFQLLSPLLF
jgi:hypothetical protein